jgi:hypothetical protein
MKGQVTWHGTGRVGTGQTGTGWAGTARAGTGWMGWDGSVGDRLVEDGSVGDGSGRAGTGRAGTGWVGIGQLVMGGAAMDWAAMGRAAMGQAAMGKAGSGLVWDRSVGNGLVAKKVAADPPSFNWFSYKMHAQFRYKNIPNVSGQWMSHHQLAVKELSKLSLLPADNETSIVPKRSGYLCHCTDTGFVS